MEIKSVDPLHTFKKRFKDFYDNNIIPQALNLI